MKRAAMIVAIVAPLALSCAPPRPVEPPAPPPAPSGPVVEFSFNALDDNKEITTASQRGRFTVIGFFTTYDTPSQIEARVLARIYRSHAPRLNMFALVLEPPDHSPIVRAFASTMDLPYPLAIADPATIAGRGPFAGLHHVPSVVVLDREGREVHRHVGLIDEAGLERALREAEGPSLANDRVKRDPP